MHIKNNFNSKCSNFQEKKKKKAVGQKTISASKLPINVCLVMLWEAHKYQWQLTGRRAKKFALHAVILRRDMHFVVMELRCCLQKSWPKFFYICVVLKKFKHVCQHKFSCCEGEHVCLILSCDWILCVVTGTQLIQDSNHCCPNPSCLLWQLDSWRPEAAHCKAAEFR